MITLKSLPILHAKFRIKVHRLADVSVKSDSPRPQSRLILYSDKSVAAGCSVASHAASVVEAPIGSKFCDVGCLRAGRAASCDIDATISRIC